MPAPTYDTMSVNLLAFHGCGLASASTAACSRMVTRCPACAIPMAAARPPSPAPMTPTCNLSSAMMGNGQENGYRIGLGNNDRVLNSTIAAVSRLEQWPTVRSGRTAVRRYWKTVSTPAYCQSPEKIELACMQVDI